MHLGCIKCILKCIFFLEILKVDEKWGELHENRLSWVFEDAEYNFGIDFYQRWQRWLYGAAGGDFGGKLLAVLKSFKNFSSWVPRRLS